MVSSSASCSSKTGKYDVISEDDPWYECSSFDVSSFFDPEEYEYTYFESVGTTDNSIYLKAYAHKPFDYSKDMTEEAYLEYFDQYILEYSFDGDLISKTSYKPTIDNNIYRGLLKAWVSEGKLNILEEEYSLIEDASRYILNGEPLVIPEDYFRYDTVHIEDIYTVSGYTIIRLNRSWDYALLMLFKPDGSCDFYTVDDLVKSAVSYCEDFIPEDDGKVLLPVVLSDYDFVYLSIDLATMETEELQSLYGTKNYMIEYASGKSLAKDYTGISFIDHSTGKLDPICEYSNIDMPMIDVIESSILYISGDGDEIILGGETYDNSGSYSGGYKISHLTRASSNPNAGKTVLILSNDNESYSFEEADYMAVYLFNQRNDSYFVKYVFPLDNNGEFKKTDADIIRSTDSFPDPSDREKYIDMAPYLELNDRSGKQKYFTNAIDASMDGDAVYRVPLNISATGILTASVNVPEGQHGFTFDSYVKFVDEVCNGIDPMTSTPSFKLNKSEYFTRLFMNMSDLFIKDGRVDLGGAEFRKLMEFVEEHGNDNTDDESGDVGLHNQAIMEIQAEIEDHNARLEGKYGAVYDNLYSFNSYIDCYRMYGEGLGIYGLPSFDGRGPMTMSTEFVYVSNTTAYPDACAEFVKLLLSDEIQCLMYSNPVNRDALRTKTEEQLNSYNEQLLNQSYSDRPVTESDLIPYEAIDKYFDILSSSYGGMSIGSAVEDILIEESSAYFNGSRSLDDVIPVMQNRIQTVLNENK